MDLDEIEARANAATEGPWATFSAYGSLGVEADEEMVFIETDGVTYAAHAPDAEFIAHARTDVPALVARVRELEGEVERLDAFGAAMNGQFAAALEERDRAQGWLTLVNRSASELAIERDEARRERDELRALVAARESGATHLARRCVQIDAVRDAERREAERVRALLDPIDKEENGD